MKKIILFFVLIVSIQMNSQEQISLDACYELVSINYPLAKQAELLDKKNALELAIIDTEKLPQLDVTAQATYQSEVIGIPIPNSGLTPPNKDQYRAMFNVNQLIYAGGVINAKTNLKNAVLNTQHKQLEVNLYQLKKQVNQIYFSILLAQEQHQLLTLKQAQLETKLKEIKSGIKNGIILPSSDKLLEAELLKIKLQFVEVENSRKTLITTLSSLIGKNLSADISFSNPEIILNLSDSISRPELELFQLKKTEIETSEQLLSKQNSPKFFGFANGGYGNPGLNPLDNSFQPFYTVGLKLNWNIFDWNSTKKQRQSVIINRDIVNTEENTFKLNTNIELNQLQTEMTKIIEFIGTDVEIIDLRKEVLKSAESQLKNGIITSSAYITELTKLYEDENNLSIHQIQLMLAKANYKITKGQ